MSLRIFRFPVDITPYQRLRIPTPGVPLSVAPCRDDSYTIDLWAMCEGGTEGDPVGIYVYGTGYPMDPQVVAWGKFIGTAVMPDGLVWHVWEGPLQ